MNQARTTVAIAEAAVHAAEARRDLREGRLAARPRLPEPSGSRSP